MSKSDTTILTFIVAAAIIAMSFTLVYAQSPAETPRGRSGADMNAASGGAKAKIVGSYKVVLKLPKATPTAILTFCSSGEPFTGAWVENDGEKFVGEMYNQKISGNQYSFTVKAGPGIWDFVCSSDGKILKGTVTGDGATSSFEGPLITLKKEYCTK